MKITYFDTSKNAFLIVVSHHWKNFRYFKYSTCLLLKLIIESFNILVNVYHVICVAFCLIE